jgi:hypothetical protein
VNCGFAPTELERLSGCLDRLVPHVERDRVAIAGGVAIQLGLEAAGFKGARRELADLDLVAASIDVITPAVVESFLVSHYHVVRPGVPKFMIQLVDPVLRIRIDVFPDLAGSIADARAMAVGGHTLLVLPLERIFEHKVQTLSRASASAPIDPKHVRDARRLGEVLGRQAPDIAPEALAPDVYGIDDDGSCERCELTHHSDWPLAPKDRVFELLGWDWRIATDQ